MKNYIPRVIIIICLNTVFATWTFGQSSLPDSIFSAQVLAKSKADYNKQIGWQSRLFNGIKYVEYKPGYRGNAYYQSGEFQNATLHYDDVDLYDVPILYDLYREMVVIKYAGDTSYVSLINNKLDKFIICNHTFIRIDADKDQKEIKTGFYELLYNGKSQLLKKYSKDIQQERSGLNIQDVFNEHTAYFLLKNNSYYSVSGKRSLLNLFKDKKKEIDNYIKLNKIDFSDNKELAMVKVASYYDQLSN